MGKLLAAVAETVALQILILAMENGKITLSGPDARAIKSNLAKRHSARLLRFSEAYLKAMEHKHG